MAGKESKKRIKESKLIQQLEKQQQQQEEEEAEKARGTDLQQTKGSLWIV